MKLRNIILIAGLSISMLACTSKPQEKWLLGFEKTAINPIMTADSSFVFHDPISNTLVH